MAALSNDPARCELMNLGYEAQGHGPYLVRQEGYPPGSSDFRPQHFLLQRDGRWLLNFAFVMLPEVEQEAQLFHSMNEVLMFPGSTLVPPCRGECTDAHGCQCGGDYGSF